MQSLQLPFTTTLDLQILALKWQQNNAYLIWQQSLPQGLLGGGLQAEEEAHTYLFRPMAHSARARTNNSQKTTPCGCWGL